jgi:hypothetical protein
MKVLKHLSVGFVAVATILSLAQGSAFAAAKPGVTPQAVNSYRPCWTVESDSVTETLYIGSNENCTTDPDSDFLMGKVTVKRDSSTKWTVTVYDLHCDSIGDYWKAHEANGSQFNLGDKGGCAGRPTGGSPYTITKAQLATTSVNWWVLWGGWNSPPLYFP